MTKPKNFSDELRELRKTDEFFLGNVARSMREVRRQMRLTLSEMSERTGVSSSYISYFEQGKRFPSSTYLMALVREFNVNMNYLFYGELGNELFYEEPDEEDFVPDFGSNMRDVLKMLELMKKVPSVKYSMLEFFHNYTVRNTDIIEQGLRDWMIAEEGENWDKDDDEDDEEEREEDEYDEDDEDDAPEIPTPFS